MEKEKKNQPGGQYPLPTTKQLGACGVGGLIIETQQKIGHLMVHTVKTNTETKVRFAPGLLFSIIFETRYPISILHLFFFSFSSFSVNTHTHTHTAR